MAEVAVMDTTVILEDMAHLEVVVVSLEVDRVLFDKGPRQCGRNNHISEK